MFDAETITAPLPGENPCGSSAKHEPEYEGVVAEIRKPESLNPEPVNWGRVVELASEVLSQKSKDLLIASYLCYGLFETEGYAGLANGLEAYVALIDRFWEDVFPEKRRMRGRIAAVEWLTVRLERGFEDKKPSSRDAEHTKKIVALLEAMEAGLTGRIGEITDEVLREKIEKDAPEFSGLVRTVKSFEKGFEQAATPTQPAPPPRQPASPTATAPAEITEDGDISKALRQCQSVLWSIAKFLFDKKLEDPVPYRLNRVGRWIDIDELPPHREGITQIGLGAADRVQRIEACLGNKDFRSLIMEAEEGFARAPFWLDAHRYTAQAVEELGSAFRAAKAAVVAEVGHFLDRLPGALDLKFKDGTPFADEQTRFWIQHEVLDARDEGSGEGAAQDGGDDPAGDSPAEAERKARALAAKGKFEQAIALFRDGLRRTGSARERFCWTLTQARFCCEVGQEELAVPQLERLDQESERFCLSEWEPKLSLDVVQTLLLCYVKIAEKTRKPSPTIVDKAEALYARLCQMDLGTAFSVDMKPLGR
jgi:type VI secretion system protein VasJ